jgi:hypothetical protein
MEADTLKKILVYSAVAVVLGVVLTLAPLIALAGIKAEYHFLMRLPLSEGLEQLEGTHGLEEPKYSISDVEILGFSFVIASVAYLLFKRRTSHHDYRWGRPFPF